METIFTATPFTQVNQPLGFDKWKHAKILLTTRLLTALESRTVYVEANQFSDILWNSMDHDNADKPIQLLTGKNCSSWWRSDIWKKETQIAHAWIREWIFFLGYLAVARFGETIITYYKITWTIWSKRFVKKKISTGKKCVVTTINEKKWDFLRLFATYFQLVFLFVWNNVLSVSSPSTIARLSTTPITRMKQYRKKQKTIIKKTTEKRILTALDALDGTAYEQPSTRHNYCKICKKFFKIRSVCCMGCMAMIDKGLHKHYLNCIMS